MSTAQTHEFKTEVKQLLDLMIHSLYSHKEIFLRELISNASDAIDKARYQSLTDSSILEGETDWRIKLTPDKEARTLSVRDNGIGMNMDDAVAALGTIAHSGTKEFAEALRSGAVQENPDLIGQFGVGFYSSFMVAEKVVVLSRRAGDAPENGVRWESAADGSYQVEPCTRESKGTEVILYLQEDESKYLEEWELRSTVRKYSDYIEHPILMDVEREEKDPEDEEKTIKTVKEETLNSQKAIWLKDKSEVTQEEYQEFYKHVSRDWQEPAEIIHFRAEGTTEFSALLYLPQKAPFDLFYKEFKVGPMLYVKRVQIMEHCEDLLPVWLRFVKGVVDSSDLPLNVSREILQNNRLITTIRKNLTKRVLDALKRMKNAEDNQKYIDFWNEFGKVLKEGIHYDQERKDAIAELMLIESTKTEVGAYTDLTSYVEQMPEDQKEIYYITGESRAEIEHSPYLEAFRDKGYEVLFFTDEIDDYIVSSLGKFAEKEFKNVIKGDIELDSEREKERKEAQEEHKSLLEALHERIKDDVKEVRLSARLKDSACCLVTGEGDVDPQMERLLKQMGQDVPGGSRVLEINPDHPILERLQAAYDGDKDSELIGKYARLLLDQALIMEGSKPKDPAAFGRMVSELMARA